MAGKTLEDAIQGMIDDVQRATISAALLTKDQVKKDFENAAKESVDKYYEYKKGYYTRHLRQYRLYKTYSVKTDIQKSKGGIGINATIRMSSDPLEGEYFSNSTRPFGVGPQRPASYGKTPVDAEYVFENFIYGRHPWTNGWPISGADDLEYKEFTKRPTPNSFLNNYIDSYGEKYFSKRFEQNLMKLLKAYL